MTRELAKGERGTTCGAQRPVHLPNLQFEERTVLTEKTSQRGPLSAVEGT